MSSPHEQSADDAGLGTGGVERPAHEPTQELDLSLEEHSGLEELGDGADKATSIELPRPVRRGQRKAQPAEPSQPAAEPEESGRTSQTELSRTLDALSGTMLGSFRLLRPLASGGMGAVFLARKDGISGVRQHAAVKLVHTQLSGQRDFIDMFLDEARIASYVQHPNVCRVLDFGVAQGTYYLAMEYVHGETWATLIERLAEIDGMTQTLPALTAFILAQTAEGLHSAHTATGDDGQPLQIVHRDVSPQNIFVGYDGTVRVIDFGVARARDRITNTRTGVVKGKIAYMSPEQITGENVDPRSDVWALGVILREALENRRLFRRNNDTETIRALVMEPIPEWTVPVDPALRKIANRALERNPADRFQSARELAAALSNYLLRRTASVGSAEVSTLMHRLFANELEQKRALLRNEPTPQPSVRNPGKAEPTMLSDHPESSHMRALRSARWLLPVALLVVLGSFSLLRARRTNHVATAALVARNDDGTLNDRPSELLALAPAVETPPSVVVEPVVEPDARPEHGSLLVAYAGGWAEVHERGRLLGTTPGRFRLSAGSHTLHIKPFGKGPGFTRQVTIEPGATGKLLLGQ